MQRQAQRLEPRNTKSCQKPGESHGIDFPSEPPERTNPAATLSLDFWPPELWEDEFALSHPVCGHLSWWPRKHSFQDGELFSRKALMGFSEPLTEGLCVQRGCPKQPMRGNLVPISRPRNHQAGWPGSQGPLGIPPGSLFPGGQTGPGWCQEIAIPGNV